MRGYYGPPVRWHGRSAVPLVGLTLYHSVGDRDRAVHELDVAWGVFVGELFSAMGVDPNRLSLTIADMADPVKRQAFLAAHAEIAKSKLFPIWQNIISPVFAEWKHFYADQSSWNEFLTSWEQYEGWYKKLDDMRKVAQAAGFVLKSPNLGAPPATVFASAEQKAEDVVHAGADAARDVWGTVKIALYIGLGVAATAVLAGVVSDVKNDRDPTAKYLALARRR